jgi:hypothetical protein
VRAMDLKDSSSEKKKARRDHTLVWEARAGDPRNVDDAHFRVQATVAGDRPASLGSFWKLPEAYERDRSSRNLLSIVLLALRIAVVALGIVRGVWMTFHKIREGAVRWGMVIRLAVPVTLLMAVSALLSLHLMMQSYRTEVPYETFLTVSYISLLMAAIFGFLMMGGAAALLTSFFPDCITALKRSNRRVLAIDAVVALLAAIGMELGLGHLHALLDARFHAQALITIASPNLIGSRAPAISAIADAARSVLFSGAVLGVFILIAQRLPRRWMWIPLGLLTACALLPDVHTAGEFALGYALACLTVMCGAVFCLWIGRDNYLAYLLVLLVMALRGPLAELFGNANPALQVQGYLVATALAAVVIWAVAPAFGKRVEAA